jgi:hypothetical protein
MPSVGFAGNLPGFSDAAAIDLQSMAFHTVPSEEPPAASGHLRPRSVHLSLERGNLEEDRNCEGRNGPRRGGATLRPAHGAVRVSQLFA